MVWFYWCFVMPPSLSGGWFMPHPHSHLAHLAYMDRTCLLPHLPHLPWLEGEEEEERKGRERLEGGDDNEGRGGETSYLYTHSYTVCWFCSMPCYPHIYLHKKKKKRLPRRVGVERDGVVAALLPLPLPTGVSVARGGQRHTGGQDNRCLTIMGLAAYAAATNAYGLGEHSRRGRTIICGRRHARKT